MNAQDYTICITNFSRPDHLRRCLESVKNLPNVVVASYGADVVLHQAIIDEVRPGTRCYLTEADYGCNRLWLQSVVLAETKWVVILHDDDQLVPEFEDALASVDTSGAGFIGWDGTCDFYDGRNAEVWYPFSKPLETGLLSSLPLIDAVTRPNSGMHESHGMVASPVTMMLQKDIAMAVLSWCETGLKDFCARPTMMIGNEIALLFGHLKISSKWFHIAKPLVKTGYWAGSETVKWYEGSNPELMNLYEGVRNKFGKEQFLFRKDKIAPIFTHVYTTGGYNDRKQLATETWYSEFKTIEKDMLIVPLCVDDRDFSRSSKSFGDVRALPFVRDIITKANSFGYGPNDVIMLTNDDVCLVEGTLQKMITRAKEIGSTYAHRRDFHGWMIDRLKNKKLENNLTLDELKIGQSHSGTDTILMTRDWWFNIGEAHLPDYVIGCEAWDTIMIMIMRMSGSGWGFKNSTYHQYHGGWWEDNANRFTNIGQLHNRKLSKEKLISYGVYKGEFEPHAAIDPAYPPNPPGFDDDVSETMPCYIGLQNHSQDNVNWNTP